MTRGIKVLVAENDAGFRNMVEGSLRESHELIHRVSKRVNVRAHNPWISAVSASSVLLGGFILRHLIVYAGQATRVISFG